MPLKIVFAGTPAFAAVALEALCDAGFDVVLALTQPDRRAGRGMQLQASPVKQYAQRKNIPVLQPTSLRLNGAHADDAALAHEVLRATLYDVMVVAAYGLILPQSILSIPRLGCINIHASLLPRWRGAAPIHRAIEAGDAQTGITIMQMDEGLDTGAMLMRSAVTILDDDTTASLHDKLAVLGGTLTVEVLQRLVKGAIIPEPQPAEGVTYAAKIMKEEAAIDFNAPAYIVARKIRAFNPFPVATVSFQNETIKIWQAKVLATSFSEATPGTIVAANERDGVIVSCQTGALVLTELQRQGGKRLPATEFIKGLSLQGGFFGKIVAKAERT